MPTPVPPLPPQMLEAYARGALRATLAEYADPSRVLTLADIDHVIEQLRTLRHHLAECVI